ncbi:hypothetical protein ACFPYI_14830 [Halomarina salina]|uniref:Uncharacterized protein n=1 Tax=Halomarina salina TaxID=1872699 RepID=A0ABD5RQU4_9EURY|nr:hypothetical protein [Halomarina salina]
MERRTVSIVLLLLSLPLFAAPAMLPVEDVRMHDTTSYLGENATVTDSPAVRVVAYENLSTHAQDLYRQTLEHDGTYRVAIDDGASDYRYYNGNGQFKSLVIERPANSTLPPADESYHPQYELMTTSTVRPPLFSGAYVPQMMLLFLAICSLLSGLYLFFNDHA